MRYRFIAVIALFFVLFPSLSWGFEEWNLPGITIITREERGADESRKWTDSGWYNRFIQSNENFEKRERGDIIDANGIYASRQTREQTRAKQNSYMINNFPDEYVPDRTIEEENGNDLRWPIAYKEDKTKIVIHHTASPGDYDNLAQVYSGLQYIYKLHAHKNGWGDIGYNFLIDRFGNIYEGRAGGPDVVAAHASWNNVKSIGIAMMGNFNNEEPSPEMMQSLLRLTTMLAVKYDIDPYKEQYYFTAYDYEPYMELSEHESIVGHKDTKNTACPGTHLYEKLPEIKQTVNQYLTFLKNAGVDNLDEIELLKKQKPVFLEDEKGSFLIDIPVGREVTCKSLSDNIDLLSCRRDGDKLRLFVQYDQYPGSGIFTIGVLSGKDRYLLDVPVIWQADLERYLTDTKNKYIVANGRPAMPEAREKVEDKMNIQDIVRSMNQDVRVLLYEVTALFDAWELVCDSGCTAVVDGDRVSDVTVVNVIENEGKDGLIVFLNGERRDAKEISLENKNGLIEITNYTRAANGLKYNVFRGDIHIHQDSYKHLDYGWLDRYVVVNELPLEEYMAGIAESSELQHMEKTKTLAMLVKNYALFYLNGSNPHPSIPDDASYNAVDDPRIFQKYVGAGVEGYGKKWLQAVEETKDLVIMYDGYLPILPYFHCSAGFTWSGRENRGWTDTPWLQSVIDFDACPTGQFAGHGVGLSGNGAQRLATKGASFEEIIKWYYQGVDIVEMRR